jgi:pimeloyl-ACP methyl ester carboxylesterase
MTHAHEIRGGTVLPARRENIELHTDDGLTLVGELALPETAAPVATLVTLHPLPTAGGFMDSHIIRKAAARLPALADVAVLRFNFRGVSSPRGTSEGVFGHGDDEAHDLEAAMRFVAERGLPHPWIVGWSFGTEVALKYGLRHAIEGAILLSPALAPHVGRGGRRVGGRRSSARRRHPGARRLPAPRRGRPAVCVGARTRVRARRGRQAPVGRRGADLSGAHRGRRPGQSRSAAAAAHLAVAPREPRAAPRCAVSRPTALPAAARRPG